MRILPVLLLMIAGTSIAANVLADPTRPPSPAEIRAWFDRDTGADETPTHWRLQSVLLSEHRRIAIINNRRVGVDDRIDQARIVAIEPGRVILDHHGEQIILTIESRIESVRKPLGD